MFGSLTWFATGTVIGVYVAQNYQVPNVRRYVDQFKMYAEQLEEANRKSKK